MYAPLRKGIVFFRSIPDPHQQMKLFFIDAVAGHLVGGSRGQNKANRNIVRQITKFGMIVFCKIYINIWI